jgi:hypothetical protein
MLMNNGNTLASCFGASQNRSFDAILQDPPTVWLIDPSQNLDDGTFSGPILAGQGMDPPGTQAQIDIAENLDGSEAFCDSAEFNYRRL